MTKKAEELRSRGFPTKCPACRSAKVDVTTEGVFHCKKCGYSNNSRANQ